MASTLRNRCLSLYKIAPQLFSRNPQIVNIVKNSNQRCLFTRDVPSFISRHLLSTSADALPITPETEANTENVESAEAAPVLRRRNFLPMNPTVMNAAQMLNKLDAEAKRNGRVSRQDVETALRMIEEKGDVTDLQAQLLLGCTGKVLPSEHPTNRAAFTQQVWQKLIACGLSLKTVHYNALMKSHLENEFPFKPEEILAEMESKNLTPNKITLQRLIARYCEIGDIEGASRVLESMKTSGYPVSEIIFNAFILGHLRAGDVESARGMFDVMRKAGLDPDQSTYRTLMCGLAEKGDMEGIKLALADAESNEVVIHANSMQAIILALVKHGHDGLTSQIPLDMLKSSGYVNVTINNVMAATALGNKDVAMDLLHSVRKLSSGTSKLGRYIISAMITADKPIEEISEMFKTLAAQGLIEDDSVDILFSALNLNKPELSLQLIDKIHSEGYPVRLHYFWPIIKQFGDQSNEEGVYKTLAAIVKINEKNKFATLTERQTTLTDFVLPTLFKLDVSINDMASKIQETQFMTVGGINTLIMMMSVDRQKGQEAADFVTNCGPLDFMKYRQSLASSLFGSYRRAKKDWSAVSPVIEALNKRSSRNSKPLNGSLLRKVAGDFSNTDISVTEGIFTDCKDKKMLLTLQDGNDVREILQEKGAPPEILELAHSLISEKEAEIQRQEKETFTQMSLEELETLVEQLGESRTNTMVKHLLIKYCIAQDQDKANALKADLEARKFEFGPEIVRALGEMLIKKKDLQGAMHHLTQLQAEYPSYRPYANFLMLTCVELAKAERLEEALSLMKTFAESHPDEIRRIQEKPYSNLRQCRQFIEAILDKKDLDTCIQSIKFLFENGLLPNGMVEMLRSFVTSVAEKGSAEDVLQALQFVYQEYDKVAAYHNVFTALIKKEDPTRLQKAVDMVTAKMGKTDTVLDLGMAFMLCDKKAQARKIMETISFPNPRILRERVIARMNFFSSVNEIKKVEMLVELTKTSSLLDRSQMLHNLINSFCKAKLWQKAIDVVTQYEEEGLVPKPQTLNFLAKHLTKNNQPIPFDIPKLEYKVTDADPLKDAENALKIKDTDKFHKIRKSMVEHDDFFIELYDNLPNNKLKVELLRQLEIHDDKKKLKRLQQLNKEDSGLLRWMFKWLCKGDRYDDAMDFLMENPSNLDNIFRNTFDDINNDILKFLGEDHPELLNRVFKQIMTLYGEDKKTYRHSFGRLCAYLLCHGHEADLQTIHEIHLETYRLMDVYCVGMYCRANNTVEPIEKLISYLKAQDHQKSPNIRRHIAFLYGQIVQVHLNDLDYGQATQAWLQAFESGQEIVDTVVLHKLQSSLLMNKLPLPWQRNYMRDHLAKLEKKSKRQQDRLSEFS